MIRLLVLGLMFTLWSLAVAAPVNNTAQHKGIVFPKKIKIGSTETMEEHKTSPDYLTTTSPSSITSTETTSESSSTSSHTYIPHTVDEETSGVSIEKEDDASLTPTIHEEPEYDPNETSHQEPVDNSEPVPDAVPLPDDATDGMIEYNLGNPLALRLHLPWWPLKDMLKSIQDAISVMNLTMSADTLDSENTKTEIVQFDDRNYTLKVRVFKPHENNRLLVRLISLTPVIEEGKIPTEKKGVKIEDEQKNEALEESESKPLPQITKIDEEKEGGGEEKEDDDDDKKEKEEKKKTKTSKKEKPSKKKKEEKKGSESDSDSD